VPHVPGAIVRLHAGERDGQRPSSLLVPSTGPAAPNPAEAGAQDAPRGPTLPPPCRPQDGDPGHNRCVHDALEERLGEGPRICSEGDYMDFLDSHVHHLLDRCSSRDEL